MKAIDAPCQRPRGGPCENTAGGQAITLTVEGLGDQGLLRSLPLPLRVAAVPVAGGLYYCNTLGGGKLVRVEFGTQEPPEQFWPPPGPAVDRARAATPYPQIART